MLENHSFDNIAGYWDFHKGIDNLVNTDYCNEVSALRKCIYSKMLISS